jgi:hypothetical protein
MLIGMYKSTFNIDYLPEEETDDIPAPGTPVRQ